MSLIPFRSLTTTLFLGAIGLFAFMWYYTNQINQGVFVPNISAPKANVRIVEVREGVIRLQPLDGGDASIWNRDGLFGLEWQGGYAQVGRIIDVHPGQVLRELTTAGAVPPEGIDARLDTFVYSSDPLTDHGIAYEEVSIQSPGGAGPAWYVPGTSDSWAIFVHGKGSSRRESLRLLPTLHEQGLPVLVVTYRNDEDYAPTGAASRYGYGESEWPDIAAAMDFAAQRGATSFVLAGNSMGGAIVMAVLQQPEYAARVQAVILDAPMLHLKRTVEFHAGERRIPAILTSAVLHFASWREQIDWSRTDYLRTAPGLQAPVLLFHGEEDSVVPISTSRALAEARPNLVTFRSVPNAGHVQAWNVDRESYILQVREFLRRVLGS